MTINPHQLASRALALVILAPHLVQAHYGFPFLIIDGKQSAWNEFVRPIEHKAERGYYGPIYAINDTDMVCGFNGINTGRQNVSTAKVEAGTQMGWRVQDQDNDFDKNPHLEFRLYEDVIFHDGPGQMFLSKSVGPLEDYKGDGDWFKIGVNRASDGVHWDNYLKHEMNFTIPKATPPGKYLARVEQFYLASKGSSTQQYISCAHIEVTGNGTGSPGPMTKFPGAYTRDDPYFETDVAPNDIPPEVKKNWHGAGPDIWTG